MHRFYLLAVSWLSYFKLFVFLTYCCDNLVSQEKAVWIPLGPILGLGIQHLTEGGSGIPSSV